MENLDNPILLEIAVHLDDLSLANFCRLNKKNRNFCLNSNLLWIRRLIRYLGKYYSLIPPNLNIVAKITYYKEKTGLSWKDYYISTMHLVYEFLNNNMEKFIPKDREDVKLLIPIMIKHSPAGIYFDNLYEDTKISQDMFVELTEEDKDF